MPKATRTTRNTWWWRLGLAGLVGLIPWLPATAPGAAPAPASAPVIYKVPVGTAPVLGPKDALVTVVIFGGFECRFTQAALQTLTTLQRAQPRDLRLVFKHYPLAFHQRSAPASEAAAEAHKAGRFWRFVERLRAGRFVLTDAALERAGAGAGLRAGAVTAALRGRAHRGTIQADRALGDLLRVTATPTIFVNGERVNGGALPAATFRGYIARATQRAQAALRQRGVSRATVYGRLIAAGIQPGPIPRPRPPVGVAISALAARPGGKAAPATGHEPTLQLAGAPSHGPEDALVTILLLMNFSCGYGNTVWDTYREAAREQPGMYRITFVHHGLAQANPQAWEAAEAAMAAHAAGKFWELADILFQNRYAMARTKLEEYASEVGLPAKAFTASLQARAYRSRLARESEEARRFLKGSTACPTVWVNGSVQSGYLSTWRLKQMLQSAAREVQGMRVRPLP